MFSRWTGSPLSVESNCVGSDPVLLPLTRGPGVWPIHFADTQSASAASVRTQFSLGIFNFLKALRIQEAKARNKYVKTKTEGLTFHIFQTRSGDEFSTRPIAQDDPSVVCPGFEFDRSNYVPRRPKVWTWLKTRSDKDVLFRARAARNLCAT